MIINKKRFSEIRSVQKILTYDHRLEKSFSDDPE